MLTNWSHLHLVSSEKANHRNCVTTIFVDAFSDINLLWHQTSTSIEQILGAKHSLEGFAAANNVSTVHYHADNGRFSESKFVDDVNLKGFSGGGAHHQNGVAEKRISNLQDSARAILIDAYRCWPDAINVHLWPYALCNAADMSQCHQK
jgi:hypothetical protein